MISPHLRPMDGMEVETVAIYPVCHMEVDEDKVAATYEYRGKTYYFCALGGKERFAR